MHSSPVHSMIQIRVAKAGGDMRFGLFGISDFRKLVFLNYQNFCNISLYPYFEYVLHVIFIRIRKAEGERVMSKWGDDKGHHTTLRRILAYASKRLTGCYDKAIRVLVSFIAKFGY